jgi:Zn-dependent protease with chaperone function
VREAALLNFDATQPHPCGTLVASSSHSLRLMSGPNVLLPLLVALVPAALRWWMGVRLVGRLDEATFPERLAAHHQRNRAVFALAIVVLIWTSPHATFWSLPLLIVSRTAAGFPFRRQIYGETWSLAGMLFFFGRLIFGAYGFWLLAINTPFLASRAGRLDWMAAALLGALLIAWHERYPEILRWLLRARPVQDRLLLDRFRPMAAAAPADRPWLFEYVNMNGGALANALALPSLRQSTVLFTSTLLERLDADEITAICAHEIAHLEYYSPDRMRRYRHVDFGLIGLAVIATPISRLAFPLEAAYAWLLVPLVILFALVVRARDRQRNETASDVRAIALCGDADALARALTKLYQFARVPRRFDAYRERSATHPSLARRIRDIRAAAGLQPAAVSSMSAFDAAHGPARVVFTPARLEWREHEGATHALEYSHLSELRLQPQRDGAQLIAVERSGRRWQMAVLARDLAAMQATLDAVDGRLGAFTAPRISPGFARLMALLAVVIGAGVTQFACAFVALAAFLRPNASMVAGSGIAALTSASLLLRDGSARGRISIAAMLFITGGALIALAWLMRSDRTEPPSMKPLAALAAAAALMLLLLLAGGLDGVRLHQSARALPSATILLVALATVLVTDRTRTVRAAAVVPLLLAAMTAGAGSMTFLDRFCTDPFLIQATAATPRSIDARPIATFDIPFEASELRLSPAGHLVAVLPDEDSDSDRHGPNTFHIGSTDGTLRPVPADDLVFVDDARVLTVSFDGADAELREVTAATPADVRWRQRIPHIRSGTLSYAPSMHEWQIRGWSDGRTLVSIRGRLDSGIQTRTEWPVPNREGWVSAVATSERQALIVDASYYPGLFDDDPFRVFERLLGPRYSARVWRMDDRGAILTAESRLGNVRCSFGDAVPGSLVCAAFDGVLTRIASVSAETGRVVPLSSIEARFVPSDRTAAGWITGSIDGRPVALRLATNEVVRLPSRRHEWTEAIAAVSSTLATISSVDDANIVRIYELPRLAARGAAR